VRWASLANVLAGSCCIRPVRPLEFLSCVLSSAGLRLSPGRAFGRSSGRSLRSYPNRDRETDTGAAELGRITGVGTADVLTGPYDVIVRVEAADVDALGKLVVTKIQAVEGITCTLTCPVVHL
jgi:DNA-binding Lrp family transcriptional regulator